MKKTIISLLMPCVITVPSMKTFNTGTNCLTNKKELQKMDIKITPRNQMLLAEYKKLIKEAQQKQAEEERKKTEEEKIKVEEERNKQMIELSRKENVGYNYYNLLEPSGITHGEMYSILYDTGMEDVAWTIVQCEIDFGVNAIILASLIAEESGWGNSSRAVNQNNLSGYAVYSDNSIGAIFDTRDDSVVATARLLKYD